MTDVVDPSRSFVTVREQHHDHDDVYVNDHLPRIDALVHQLASVGAPHFGSIPGVARKRLSSIDWTNPATVSLIAHDPSIEAWLKTIPTATALHPLYEPDAPHLPDGTRVGDEMRQWVRNLADARGIRSRAAVLSELCWRRPRLMADDRAVGCLWRVGPPSR